MIKNNFKRVLAIALSLMMVIGACFTGMFSASAEGAFTQATTSNIIGNNSGASAITIASSADGNGVNIKYVRYTGLRPTIYTENLGGNGEAFPGTNGLSLHFANYYAATGNSSGTLDCTVQTGYRKFALTFRNAEDKDQGAAAINAGRPFILFDTNNGTVSLARGKTNGTPSDYTIIETIITDDALLYDSFTSKAFDVIFTEFEANASKIQVSVIIDNGDETKTTLVGLMTKSKFFVSEDFTAISHALKASNTDYYLTITGVDSNSNTNRILWNFDFYGHTAHDETFVAPEIQYSGLTKGLDNIATADDLIAAETVERSSATDNLTGGVHLNYKGLSAYFPRTYVINLGTEGATSFPGTYGFKLQFANYTRTLVGTEYGYIALSFKNALGSGAPTLVQGVPSLLIDTQNGTLNLVTGNDSSPGNGNYKVIEEVIANDALKYSNFSNKPFAITVAPFNDKGEYTVISIDINGTVLTGYITNEIFTNYCYLAATGENIYLSIGGMDNDMDMNYPWELDFYGHKMLTEDDVIPTIDYSELASDLTGVATVADAYDIGTVNGKKFSTLPDGGVKLSYTMQSGSGRYTYTINSDRYFPGKYGFMLRFANYTREETAFDGNGMIAISLSCTAAYGGLYQDRPAILIDTNAGTMSFVRGTGTKPTQYDVINDLVVENEALQYENFTGKAFEIYFATMSVKYTVVSIKIGDTVLSGVIDNNDFFVGDFAPSKNSTKTYVSISGLDTSYDEGCPWSMNFYGWKQLDETYEIPEVEVPAFEGTFDIEAATVEFTDEGYVVKAFVDASYAGEFTGLKVNFLQDDVYTTVKSSAATVVGNKQVYEFATTSSSKVTVNLAGQHFDGTEFVSEEKVCRIATFGGQAGETYAVAGDLNLGDANGDGKTDVKDLVRMKKIVAGADIEGGVSLDGVEGFTSIDLTNLAKLLVKAKRGVRVYTVTYAELDENFEETTIIDTALVIEGYGIAMLDAPESMVWVDGTFTQVTSLENIKEDITLYAMAQ